MHDTHDHQEVWTGQIQVKLDRSDLKDYHVRTLICTQKTRSRSGCWGTTDLASTRREAKAPPRSKPKPVSWTYYAGQQARYYREHPLAKERGRPRRHLHSKPNHGSSQQNNVSRVESNEGRQRSVKTQASVTAYDVKK